MTAKVKCPDGQAVCKPECMYWSMVKKQCRYEQFGQREIKAARKRKTK